MNEFSLFRFEKDSSREMFELDVPLTVLRVDGHWMVWIFCLFTVRKQL